MIFYEYFYYEFFFYVFMQREKIIYKKRKNGKKIQTKGITYNDQHSGHLLDGAWQSAIKSTRESSVLQAETLQMSVALR